MPSVSHRQIRSLPSRVISKECVNNVGPSTLGGSHSSRLEAQHCSRCPFHPRLVVGCGTHLLLFRSSKEKVLKPDLFPRSRTLFLQRPGGRFSHGRDFQVSGRSPRLTLGPELITVNWAWADNRLDNGGHGASFTAWFNSKNTLDAM